MRTNRIRVIAAFALLVLAGSACAGVQKDEPTDDSTEASLEIGTVARSVKGNVVTLPVDVAGVEIVKPDGDTSGDSGHFHVFVDREPVAVGEAIPKERGVVHSADNPIKVWGLEPGEHEFTVVVGDGTHKRINDGLEDSVTVDVKGPSVWGKPTVKGDDVTVDLMSSGVEIVKANGDRSGDSGHFHVLVDPATPLKGGEVIPAPEEGKVYHTTEGSATITGLSKGEHILWIILGDGTHTTFDPPVMDKLTVTVT
jgi:hypothetical protein